MPGEFLFLDLRSIWSPGHATAAPTWRSCGRSASRVGWAEGIAALLEHTAADRLYARLSFFELSTAGPQALDRADVAMEAFTAYLDPRASGAETPHLPAAPVAEAIGGGIWSVIQGEIAAGRSESLPTLAPELSQIALTPYYVSTATRAL